MSDATGDDKHEKALDLTEQALEKLEEGDEKGADKMLEEAKRLDPSAVEEIVKDLDDAANAQT